MAKCNFKYGEYFCPFDTEEGSNLCIFHLPVENKDPKKFWQYFRNYLKVLIEKTEDSNIVKANESHPLFLIGKDELDEKLYVNYNNKIKERETWFFIGFQFPSMNSEYNFDAFTFASCEFSEAKFTGNAYFNNLKFLDSAIFFKTEFLGETVFYSTQFYANTDFKRAEFKDNTRFDNAEFSRYANFRHATFCRKVDFQMTSFLNFADFEDAKFILYSNFSSAKFKHQVFFNNTKFYNDVNFKKAKFSDFADFNSSKFIYNSNFDQTIFSGITNFKRTLINGKLSFINSNINNKLIFEGIDIKANSLLLFWNLYFGQGKSDIEAKEVVKGTFEGSIYTSNGSIIFMDIPEGMDRISFIHTEIYYDRPYIKFYNVGWGTNPKNFLFDTNFIFLKQIDSWKKLFESDDIELLSEIFNITMLLTKNERKRIDALIQQDAISNNFSQKTISENKLIKSLALKFIFPEPYTKDNLKDFINAIFCVDIENRNKLKKLISLDVERITREIRRFYEDFGNYPDAGDYYIAEMEYRRVRTSFTLKPIKTLFFRLALELYKLFSYYGESPSRAFLWLLFILFGGGLVYLFTGFKYFENTIAYRLIFDFSKFGKTISDYFCKAIPFAFSNLIPGYFRFASQTYQPTSQWTTIISLIEGTLGITLLTLFLLAVRRRFRR